jgi:hypothetical protein
LSIIENYWERRFSAFFTLWKLSAGFFRIDK